MALRVEPVSSHDWGGGLRGVAKRAEWFLPPGNTKARKMRTADFQTALTVQETVLVGDNSKT